MTTSTNGFAPIEVDPSRVLVFRSRAMRLVMEQVARVAPTRTCVLITGETGTGKELIARSIHRRSAQASKRLVPVDCAALAPGVLESELFGHERGAFTGADRSREGLVEFAAGSTLFLDEISSLAASTQGKLLRVLQERQFRRVGSSSQIDADFRVVAASNVDLRGEVEAGRFRPDLYYRVSSFCINIPPLRERPEDIPLLVSHLIGRKGGGLKRPNVSSMSAAGLDVLYAHDWPGNVRELENVIDAALIQCDGDRIEPAHLPSFVRCGADGPVPAAVGVYRAARQAALEDFEKNYVIAQLRWHNGRVSAAATNAGVTPKHLRTLMRRYGIDRRTWRRSA
jgi:DNA-binding NtrC family response regulator